MRKRVVPKEEIDKCYITFCNDIGATGKTVEETSASLAEKGLNVEKKENEHLIWFEQIEKNKIKYYSEPIMKYISEPEKETKFYIKTNGPIKMLHLPESSMPLYNFRQIRKNKIPPAQKIREERNVAYSFLRTLSRS